MFEANIEFTTTHESSGNRLKTAPSEILSAEYLDHTLPKPFTLTDSFSVSSETFFQTSPLERVMTTNPRIIDAFGNTLDFVEVDQQVLLAVDLKNLLDHEQSFAYIVQIKDVHGFVVALAWDYRRIGSGSAI